MFLSTGMAERPTLPQLLRFSIRGKPVSVIELIGTKYYDFGVSLLQDDTGAKMDAIIEQCREDATKINRQVLSRWLRGEGKQPVTEALENGFYFYILILTQCCTHVLRAMHCVYILMQRRMHVIITQLRKLVLLPLVL